MIDTWFKKDLQKIYAQHQVAVWIDESREAEFLLKVVEKDHTVFKVGNELEELKAKYEIEKSRSPGTTFLIYTTTPRDSLKFAREYCETNGCLEIRYLQNYVKDKVHKHLNLNLHLSKEELISAAKVSLGKTQTYWMDLSHKGGSEIFDLEKELLPFLHDPKTYLKKFDPKVQDLFFQKISELIGQPYVSKPPETRATEVVHHLFQGLLDNHPDPILYEVYKNWVDSKTYQKSLKDYLGKFKVKPGTDPAKAHPSHPFRAIDEAWFRELGENLGKRDYISSTLPLITQRAGNKIAQSLEITFWKEVKTLLEFDETNISRLSTLEECITFYTHHFYQVDQAIRKLYARFLSQKELIQPIQEYYNRLLVVFFEKWFRHFGKYTSTQTGTLQRLLDENPGKTAIVVGDGVAFEFAMDIAKQVSQDFKLESKDAVILAGIPSETEHNMSQLYLKNGDVVALKKERENFLVKNNPDKDIGFMNLDKVTQLTDQNHYLICSCKDPDKLGENYQQSALRFFQGVASLYVEKIEQLLRNGYQDVYLVTDHGYVLTGILEEAEKIEPSFAGKVSKSERYVRTQTEQQVDPDLLIGMSQEYKEFKYIYFAKRMGPFKTPGMYGFSHGGLTPQELITPFFHWTRKHSSLEGLTITVVNKKELGDVVGDLYQLRIQAASTSRDLFSSERKLILYFFSKGQKVNESDIFTIGKGEEIRKEYQFGSLDEVEVRVLDVHTLEQLDKVTVKQNKARDLGGL